MDSSAHTPEARRTEFRLLKPMPSRQEGTGSDVLSLPLQSWDTQIRRLFPARDTPAANLPSVGGIQLGHFEIEERIARGGMGTVFRARDLRLDRVVALKVLAQDQLHDPAAVQRFQNEARSAARLDHENIARVYFVGEDRGVHFIAFEYVRGTTVREAIAAKGCLSQDEAVNYALQAAEALRHTDAAGVVHRDIKPSNLIVTPSGRVKLVDLGLARQINPGEELELTVSGTTLGTFDYISPEQARDPRNVDVRSDIYSLGCTLFQMLTGSPPFPSGGSVEKLMQHSAGRPPDPCELNHRISPQLALVVQRMMASNPDDRHPSAQALIDELAELAARLGLRATAPDGTIWRKPMYRGDSPWWEANRGWLLAFAAILMLALVADDLYRWMSTFNADQQLVQSEPPAAPGPSPTLAPPPAAASPDGPAATPTAPEGAVEPEPPSAVVSVAPTSEPPAARPPRVATSQSAPVDAAGPEPDDAAVASADLQALFQASLRQSVAAATRPSNLPPPAGQALPAESEAPGEPEGTGPLEPQPAVPPAVDPAPFVILAADERSEVSRFRSLEAACHVAKSGSVIEIRADGPVASLQKPVLIQGKRLTIRPSSGFRPLLMFAPADDLRGERMIRMIDVVDGSLEVYDVDLAMQVTNRVFADEWVLLSLNRAKEAVLKRVTMTVVNAGWRPAVMIERRMTVGAPSVIMPPPTSMREADIRLDDCLFRGHAAFYADRTLEPAALQINDTAIGVESDLFRIDGADRADMESPTQSNGAVIRIGLDHVTAVTRGSGLRLFTESVRDVPEVRIDCRNSILDVHGGNRPLVVLEGHQDSDLLLQRVHWLGSRNVIVANLDQGCLVHGMWPLTEDEQSLPLAQWQVQFQPDWELTTDAVTRDAVLSWDERAAAELDALQLSDFALRPMDSAEAYNPAEGTASDSSDRGFRLLRSRLPAVLARPAVE